ncbi:MAG TPA: Rieske 2Fe-2S domain-containing protein [Burkholderiales bacterium]|nr:Rieske 2Fe-2S domain-containing protein [Burkholderiales bacterium]
MAEAKRLICASVDLAERGSGVRFSVVSPKGPQAAFVVRYRGKVHAYLNRCAHVHVELDAEEGKFFDFAGLYLVCGTHGAAYVPESGYCAIGPCKGLRLHKLAVEERDGGVYLLSDEEKLHV